MGAKARESPPLDHAPAVGATLVTRPPASPQPGSPSGTFESRSDEITAVEVVLRLGAVMLSAGSPTDDVQRAMRTAASAVGLERATAVVSFGTISVSYFSSSATQPATAMQLVPDKETDYRRLSAAATLVTELRRGSVDLAGAVTEIERIESLDTAWPEPLTSLAQAASAAASTVLFGGSGLDALATFIIGALVQPIVVRLDRSGLPPFFRSLIGPFVSSLLVALAVAVGAPIDPTLVLTGSLLRFLPGAALVAGMRDLIDQSVISGSARLAEALFLGAAVAAGTAMGIGLAGQLGIFLEVGGSEGASAQFVVQVGAAALACGFWAVRLGEPRNALITTSLIGAAAWGIYLFTAPLGSSGIVATAIAGIAVGMLGRMLARRADAPVVLWVVPASLPLLPGLLIVNGMLADSVASGLIQLTTAVATALALGAAVAFGDIVIQTIRQVREEIIQPVIVGPVTQIVQTGIQAVRQPRGKEDEAADR